MGTSHSTTELVGKLIGYADNLERASMDAVGDVALMIKMRIRAEAAKTIGGDLKMGKKRISTRYDLFPEKNEAVVYDKSGPMRWITHGVAPHAIAPKGLGGNRAARSLFVSAGLTSSFSGGPKYGKVVAPLAFAGEPHETKFKQWSRKAGKVKARRTWTIAVDASEKPSQYLWRHAHRKNLAHFF